MPFLAENNENDSIKAVRVNQDSKVVVARQLNNELKHAVKPVKAEGSENSLWVHDCEQLL